MTSFAIRALQESDVEMISSFWRDLSPVQLDEAAIDVSRLPSVEHWRTHLNKLMDTPDSQADSCAIVWLVNEEPVGFTYAFDLVQGETARVQFYFSSADLMGKGYSKPLLAHSIVELYKRFNLMAVIAETRISNERANRTLQRIGFPLIKKYSGTAISFGKTCELNRFSVDYQIAKSFLKRNRQ